MGNWEQGSQRESPRAFVWDWISQQQKVTPKAIICVFSETGRSMEAEGIGWLKGEIKSRVEVTECFQNE